MERHSSLNETMSFIRRHPGNVPVTATVLKIIECLDRGERNEDAPWFLAQHATAYQMFEMQKLRVFHFEHWRTWMVGMSSVDAKTILELSDSEPGIVPKEVLDRAAVLYVACQ